MTIGGIPWEEEEVKREMEGAQSRVLRVRLRAVQARRGSRGPRGPRRNLNSALSTHGPGRLHVRRSRRRSFWGQKFGRGVDDELEWRAGVEGGRGKQWRREAGWTQAGGVGQSGAGGRPWGQENRGDQKIGGRTLLRH